MIRTYSGSTTTYTFESEILTFYAKNLARSGSENVLNDPNKQIYWRIVHNRDEKLDRNSYAFSSFRIDFFKALLEAEIVNAFNFFVEMGLSFDFVRKSEVLSV